MKTSDDCLSLGKMKKTTRETQYNLWKGRSDLGLPWTTTWTRHSGSFYVVSMETSFQTTPPNTCKELPRGPTTTRRYGYSSFRLSWRHHQHNHSANSKTNEISVNHTLFSHLFFFFGKWIIRLVTATEPYPDGFQNKKKRGEEKKSEWTLTAFTGHNRS